MKKNIYFNFMLETTEISKTIIRGCLESIGDSKLKRTLLFYPKDRFKHKLFLRPLLIRLSYEAAGGKNWKDIAPVYAAYELLNISSYQSNLSFDKKKGINTPDKINNQFIASMISRELAQRIVCERFAGSHYLSEILKSMNTVNMNIYKGQFYDLNILHKNNLESFETMYEFMDIYIKKCLFLSGIFFEECAHIGAVLGGNCDNTAPLSNFGRDFGIGLHIVNDIANFIPIHDPEISNASDYVDLINCRLTLPIYYLLRYGEKKSAEYFIRLWNSKPLTTDTCFEMSKILIDNDAILYAKKTAKTFMKKAKHNLISLEKGKTAALLSVMTSVLKTNKYFRALRDTQGTEIRTFGLEPEDLVESIMPAFTRAN